jgi:hypothetical protein
MSYLLTYLPTIYLHMFYLPIIIYVLSTKITYSFIYVLSTYLLA